MLGIVILLKKSFIHVNHRNIYVIKLFCLTFYDLKPLSDKLYIPRLNMNIDCESFEEISDNLNMLETMIDATCLD